MMKAKQIEYLIQNLPTPEPEEVQVRWRAQPLFSYPYPYPIILKGLEIGHEL